MLCVCCSQKVMLLQSMPLRSYFIFVSSQNTMNDVQSIPVDLFSVCSQNALELAIISCKLFVFVLRKTLNGICKINSSRYFRLFLEERDYGRTPLIHAPWSEVHGRKIKREKNILVPSNAAVKLRWIRVHKCLSNSSP
jgi:hypothetical protein